MIDKIEKNKILKDSNPKHVAYLHGEDMPLVFIGNIVFVYVSDYGKFGISMSISGRRGGMKGEIFVDRKSFLDFTNKLCAYSDIEGEKS